MAAKLLVFNLKFFVSTIIRILPCNKQNGINSTGIRMSQARNRVLHIVDMRVVSPVKLLEGDVDVCALC